MKHATGYTLSLVLLLALCPLFAADQLYTVKFERPSQKGEKFGITVVSRDSHTITMTNNADGSILKKQSNEIQLKLEADVVVLEVSPKGNAVSRNYTVRSFVETSGKDTPAILPRGSVVNARIVDGKTVFYMNDQPVGDDLGAQLKAVISISSDDSDDDTVFGTDKKVAVGEKWKLDASRAADLLRSETIGIENKDIEGHAFIQGIVKKAGQDCMKIVVEINIGYLTFPLPDAVKATDSTAKIYVDQLLPVDTARSAQDQSMKVVLTVNAKGKLDETYPDISLNVMAEMSKAVEYRN